MKLKFLTPLVIGLALAGCNPNSTPETETKNAPSGSGKVEKPNYTTGKTLDVMVFKGGFGSDFYETAAKEFEAKHADEKITITGDAHIWEMVQPRFLKGDPPDLTFPGWNLDHWALVAENQLMPLDAALAEPADDGKGTWKDTFEESLLKLGRNEGKQYVLPYFFSALGWWYDPSLFKKHGWTAPKTYPELLQLCEKIKAAGIAPITYQGQYPDYMIAGMLQPWIIGTGGDKAFNDIQNLEPGAWKAPSVLMAAKMIKKLKDKGYLQDGAAAMSHTEAQTQFVTGKAAMIPCGTWLYSEMEKSMPAGTQMDFMLPPTVVGGKGDASNIMIKIEPWMIPAKAKNQRTAVDFFKYLTSLDKAKQFVKEKGTFMAIKGSNDVDLPPYLKTAADSFKNSKDVWAAQWAGWYRELYKSVETNLTSMLAGQLSPEEFCAKCEEAAQKTRDDSDILKHKVE